MPRQARPRIPNFVNFLVTVPPKLTRFVNFLVTTHPKGEVLANKKADRHFLILLVLLTFPLPAPAARPQWIKLTSTDFEMYTSAGEKKGREAILYFEQVRSFFLKALALKDIPNAQPVRIVAFSSPKEYEPYGPNEAAAAYYVTDSRRDYIIMSSIAPESYRMSVHEYTHLILGHANVKPPIWFNEGLAELYSTMKQVGKKVQVGDIIPGRLLELRQSNRIDLATLTAVGHDSPFYNEKRRAGVFYAESWALTHMLLLSPEYKACKSKVVPLLFEGKPAATDFPQACDRSLLEVQKDLMSYVRGSRFFAALFDVQLEKHAEAPDVDDASPLESGAVLADVLLLAHKRAEAKARFEELAKDYPKSWEPEAGLARLAWFYRNYDEARRHFARAAELGSTDPQLYLDYASLDAANSALLRKALELRPDWQEAQYRLGLSLITEGKYQDAIDDFRRIKKVTPAQAFQFFYGLAYASYRLDQKPQAAKYIEDARKWAKAPAEISRVDQLAAFVNGNQPVPSAARLKPPADTGDDERPTISRRTDEAPPAALPPKPKFESVDGTLRRLDCKGSSAVLTLESAGKQLHFAISDPSKVALRNTGTGQLEFQCGPQKPRPVLIEYEPRPGLPPDVTGEVRAIEFK